MLLIISVHLFCAIQLLQAFVIAQLCTVRLRSHCDEQICVNWYGPILAISCSLVSRSKQSQYQTISTSFYGSCTKHIRVVDIITKTRDASIVAAQFQPTMTGSNDLFPVYVLVVSSKKSMQTLSPRLRISDDDMKLQFIEHLDDSSSIKAGQPCRLSNGVVQTSNPPLCWQVTR